jgi:hypothetical protein
MRVIRSYWKDVPLASRIILEIPEVPPFNDVIYVYGEAAKEDIPELERRGYDVRFIDIGDMFNTVYNYLGRKLITLHLGLQDFDEVLMLDWDCIPTKPLDDNFYTRLQEKPIQVPLYAHPAEFDTIRVWEKNYFAQPNFGFVYSRDKNFGHELLEFAWNLDLKGLIDEYAMYEWLSFRNLDWYIEQFQPTVCHGVDPEAYIGKPETDNSIKQMHLINYINTKLDMDTYFKHV